MTVGVGGTGLNQRISVIEAVDRSGERPVALRGAGKTVLFGHGNAEFLVIGFQREIARHAADSLHADDDILPRCRAVGREC